MKSLNITRENVSLYSFSNIQAIEHPNLIDSIVISFHGWYETDMRTALTIFEKELAQKQVLCIYPYYSEWCWMNFSTIQLIDEIVDYYIREYQLSETIPTVVYGKSMGGLSALNFILYSKRTPIACAANCPICDLYFHANEREDIPRTLYAAYGYYDMPLESAILLHSPLHQIKHLPYIPYYIVHGVADSTVCKTYHSDPFVEQMKQLGHEIEYHQVPGMKHCDFRPCPEERSAYHNFVLKHAKKHKNGLDN